MNGRQTGQRREEWRTIVGEQEKSGQGVGAFCRDRGVSEPSFYAWRQRFRKEQSVSFALVQTERSTVGAAIVEVVLTSGDRLRIPAEETPLRTVLRVLRERA